MASEARVCCCRLSEPGNPNVVCLPIKWKLLSYHGGATCEALKKPSPRQLLKGIQVYIRNCLSPRQ